MSRIATPDWQPPLTGLRRGVDILGPLMQRAERIDTMEDDGNLLAGLYNIRGPGWTLRWAVGTRARSHVEAEVIEAVALSRGYRKR